MTFFEKKTKFVRKNEKTINKKYARNSGNIYTVETFRFLEKKKCPVVVTRSECLF